MREPLASVVELLRIAYSCLGNVPSRILILTSSSANFHIMLDFTVSSKSQK